MLSLFDKLNRRMTAPKLTRGRIAAAMTIAFVADLLQIVLLPVAWTFVQSGIDVVAMLLVMGAIGFHLLLLPTFIIEFMPGVDILPTWTACVIAVIALRKREQSSERPPSVDVEASVQTTPPSQLPPPPVIPPAHD
jgi:hypothetical protein